MTEYEITIKGDAQLSDEMARKVTIKLSAKFDKLKEKCDFEISKIKEKLKLIESKLEFLPKSQ